MGMKRTRGGVPSPMEGTACVVSLFREHGTPYGELALLSF